MILVWSLLNLAVIRQIADSGRVLQIGETPSSRIAIIREVAPGAPPVLAFRLLEGRMRHRYSGLDLVLDDAGH